MTDAHKLAVVGSPSGSGRTLAAVPTIGADLDAHELGSWAPLAVPQLDELFHGAAFRWYIAGGYALELATRRSWREHDDIDVGVCRGDLSAVRRHLHGWDLHVAAAGHLSPWNGGPLSARRHENNLWVRRTADAPWAFDITVGGGDDEAWWSRRDPGVRLSWVEAVDHDAGGVPHLAPHVQLLMKAKVVRPKDDRDAEEVIPGLSEQRRSWLARCLPPDHPWHRHC